MFQLIGGYEYMSEREKCRKCEFEDDLRGCALKHIEEARELISKGDSKGADLQLSYVEKHLREK